MAFSRPLPQRKKFGVEKGFTGIQEAGIPNANFYMDRQDAQDKGNENNFLS
jgi:hypothetical protein